VTTPAIRELFSPAPDLVYLDAATYGLPPKPTSDAVATALARWTDGTADWRNDWEPETDKSRALFAQLIGARPEEVAVIPTVSVGTGMVAGSLPAGTNVLVAETEFPSVLHPFLIAQEKYGIRVSEAPYAKLADAIMPSTNLVAFSLTQAHTGDSADLADICKQAKENWARVFIDATHSIPFVDVRPYIGSIDYLVCHGYKHLLCPRGAAFLYVRDGQWDTIDPILSNWRSATLGKAGLEHNPGASRFDISPAWPAWVGARPSLELLVQWQAEGELEGVWDLSRRLATGLELPAPTSSIVTVPVPDAEDAIARLREAGVQVAARSGNLRIAPHLYNTEDDIDRAIIAVNSVR
jgi:selenocysteine lyase/cysteine desulfurase